MIFTDLSRVLVTGPHRSGTTITTEILADELGLHPIRECDIAHPRFAGDTEPELLVDDVTGLADGFVLQGATTYRWLPQIADHFDCVVIVSRNIDDIIASQRRARGRQLDNPGAKYERLLEMNLPLKVWVDYDTLLVRHPRFVADRAGWTSRQTGP